MPDKLRLCPFEGFKIYRGIKSGATKGAFLLFFLFFSQSHYMGKLGGNPWGDLKVLVGRLESKTYGSYEWKSLD